MKKEKNQILEFIGVYSYSYIPFGNTKLTFKQSLILHTLKVLAKFFELIGNIVCICTLGFIYHSEMGSISVQSKLFFNYLKKNKDGLV